MKHPAHPAFFLLFYFAAPNFTAACENHRFSNVNMQDFYFPFKTCNSLHHLLNEEAVEFREMF
jgi:hypothetical protein